MVWSPPCPAAFCPSTRHARSILLINPLVGLLISAARGASRGQGSKPVAVLWAVAWLWDINSALSAVMKTSSTDVDHKQLLLSHTFSLRSLYFFLELLIWDVMRATDVNGMESHTLLPSLSSSLLLCWTVIHVYFGYNYNCKNCYSAVYLLCVMSHCLYLLLFALPLFPFSLSYACSLSSPLLILEPLLIWGYGALSSCEHREEWDDNGDPGLGFFLYIFFSFFSSFSWHL